MKKVEQLKKIMGYFTSLSDQPLQIEDLNREAWPLPFMFSVSVYHRGGWVSGYGQARERDKAIFIAFMEVLERILLSHSPELVYSKRKGFYKIKKEVSELLKSFSHSLNWIGKSSNGFAIHVNKHSARQNALNELIERHVILKALASHIAPGKVDPPHMETPYQTSMTHNFYAWRGPLGRYVALMRCERGTQRLYGFGCGSTLEEAKQKAFLEASPRIVSLYESLPSLVIIPNKNSFHHWHKETPWTEDFFKKATNQIPSVDSEISYRDFWFGEPKVKNEVLTKLNLYVVKAVCPKIQILFSGHWDLKYINPEAIDMAHGFPPDMHMIG